MIHLQGGKLQNFRGNYDSYVKTRADREIEQQKKYEWEQEQIRHMKEYIARFGGEREKDFLGNIWDFYKMVGGVVGR